ncbi:MAG: hypothetical protein CMI36_01590 [Owenweeksia sp.]|nr:hypothetical protein [Owenweeksia sp.]MBF97656.1 hypothetical protein [Owenweeksia sp.]HBF21295.1 hypothetical protein [Cryomorphaceae bacterium]|tara:strand:+ start:634 stop:996 length:363 start_codon:yes stop_codon:yes gene_type:complete
MAQPEADFFKIPMIYLSKYINEEEQTRYRLYVGMAMGEEEEFHLPPTPSTLSDCDVYVIHVESLINDNSELMGIQTVFRSDIEATCRTIEVRVTDGTNTRRAKMNYDQADHGGLGGGHAE